MSQILNRELNIPLDINGIYSTSAKGKQLMRNMEPEKTKSLYCHECGKVFKRNSKFITHMRVHTGEKPFICEVCGKGFANPYSLIAHKRIHTGERPYACDICGKRFIENSALNKHIMRHKGERTYVCKICTKAFNTNSDLAVHVKNHSVDRSFECDICSKSYSFKSSLTRHMNKVHLKPEAYTCKLCDEIFPEYELLKEHKKMLHPNEKVIKLSSSSEFCDKNIFDMSNMGEHSIFYDPKRFWCSICDKVYTTKYNFNNHMLKHENDITEHTSTVKNLPEQVYIQEEPEVILNENVNEEEEVQNEEIKLNTAKIKTIYCKVEHVEEESTIDESCRSIVSGKLQSSVMENFIDIKVKKESVDDDSVEDVVMMGSDVQPAMDNKLSSAQHFVQVSHTDSSNLNFQEDVSCSDDDNSDADPLA